MAGRPLSGPHSASDSISQGVLEKHRNWRCWRIATPPRTRLALPAGNLLQVIPSCTPADSRGTQHAPRSTVARHRQCRGAKFPAWYRCRLGGGLKRTAQSCHHQTPHGTSLPQRGLSARWSLTYGTSVSCCVSLSRPMSDRCKRCCRVRRVRSNKRPRGQAGLHGRSTRRDWEAPVPPNPEPRAPSRLTGDRGVGNPHVHGPCAFSRGLLYNTGTPTIGSRFQPIARPST